MENIVLNHEYNMIVHNKQSGLQFEGKEDMKNIPFHSPQTITFYQQFIHIVDIKQIKQLKSIIKDFYPQLIPQEDKQKQGNTVCAKIVKQGDTIVQCFDCRVDSSCIICMDCYKNGDHKGHKVLFKKAYGGCCDCGDPEAWNPSGFCKIHSGEALQIQIPLSISKNFVRSMQDLFYIYFYFKLNFNKPDVVKLSKFFFHTLTQFLLQVIAKGLIGIKLISLFFNSKMPRQLLYNMKLQQQSVIYQIFTYQLVGVDMRQWQNIMIQMFPYYEFKKQLIQAYISCIPRLHTNQVVASYGQSISCQILTSYKLVQEYIKLESSKPIGYQINKQSYDMEELQNIYFSISLDLKKICKLQGKVPQQYTIFHFSQSNGLDSIFGFQEKLLKTLQGQSLQIQNQQKKAIKSKKQKKKKKLIKRRQNTSSPLEDTQEEILLCNAVYFVIRNIKYIQLQYNALIIFNNLLQNIAHNQAALLQVLRQCIYHIKKSNNPLIIFRPYQRAFALIVFYLCSANVQNLNSNWIVGVTKSLQMNEKQWIMLIENIENRMLQCFLFYTHIMTNQSKGYHSSFYSYLYFYRIKDKFLSSIDILCLKILASLKVIPSKYQFDKYIRIQDYQPPKWNSLTFKVFIQEIHLMYLGSFPQINIVHFNPHAQFNKHYQKDILKYLSKFITVQGSIVTLQRANQFCKAYLFDNNDLLKDYLKQCCIFNKQKKVFQLKESFKDQNALNYMDFELRGGSDHFVNKPSQFQLSRTIQLISQHNKHIFNSFWTLENLETIKVIILSIYQDIRQKQQETIIQYLKLVLKFVSIVKAIGTQDQGLFVQEILMRLQLKDLQKKLEQFKDLFGDNHQIYQQGSSIMQQKKELMKQKKNKKLEQLKKKKQQNMLRIKQVHNQMQIQKEEQYEDYCVICRRKDNPKYQLVFIAKIFFRDYQSFFSKGSGVVSPFFRSCYHVFDYQCIRESTIKKSTTERFRCPICRTVGNFFMPAYPLEDVEKSKNIVQSCRDYLTNLTFLLKNYQSVNIQEQILKSFYNFALVFTYQPQIIQKLHLKIYRAFFQLLLTPTFSSTLPKLILKFKMQTINLRPKAVKQKNKKNVNLLKAQQLNDDDFQIDSSDQQGIQYFMDLIRQQHENLEYKKIEKNQEKMVEKEMKKTKSKKEEYSIEFIYISLRVLNQLNKQRKISNENIQQLQSQQFLDKAIMPDVSLEIEYIADLITKNKSMIDPSALTKSQFKFIQLPPFYKWDMNQNKCDHCNQPCFDMMVCLICGWKGCLNCKGGGIQKHYKRNHGAICASIRLKDGRCYIIGEQDLKFIGCLYKNQWGEQFNIKRNWEQYLLQRQIIDLSISIMIKNQ